MTKIHVLKDETLGGIEREYIEVDRKAEVGDYAHVFNHPSSKGDGIKRVEETKPDGHIYYGRFGRQYLGYKTLEPTDIVHIATDDSPGTRFRLVDRKAEVGEKVIIVDDGDIPQHNGMMGEVVFEYGGPISVNVGESIGYYPYVETGDEYRVLEPVANAAEPCACVTESEASPQVIDMLANLARRVVSLESQLTATQRNVETLARELEGVKHAQKPAAFEALARHEGGFSR